MRLRAFSSSAFAAAKRLSAPSFNSAAAKVAFSASLSCSVAALRVPCRSKGHLSCYSHGPASWSQSSPPAHLSSTDKLVSLKLYLGESFCCPGKVASEVLGSHKLYVSGVPLFCSRRAQAQYAS